MSRYLKLLVPLLMVLLVLGIAEGVLRMMGSSPGALYFHPVFRGDQHEAPANYFVDEQGVLKQNPAEIERLAVSLGTNCETVFGIDEVELSFFYLLSGFYPEARKCYCETHLPTLKHAGYFDSLPCLTEGPGLAGYISGLQTRDSLDEFEQMVIEYTQKPINSDGFRSVEFGNYDTKKKKVLLLGDSFTYGNSAHPITESFADLLLKAGYATFNTGISATDPAQYLAITEKYVPQLRPEYVVLNFFLGNDIMHYPRTAEAGKYIYYPALGYWIPNFYEGEYVGSFDDAAEEFRKRLSIPDQEEQFWNRMAASTVLGTKVWSIFKKGRFSLENTPDADQYLQTNEYLKRIQTVCEANGSRFLIMLIPEHHDLEFKQLDNYPGLFENLPYHLPVGLTPEDYDSKHGVHFNNKGHAKYSASLIDQLK